MKPISLLCCILLLSVTASAGSIYKWRDKDGKLHFSQKPPPADATRLERSENKGAQNTLQSRWSGQMKSNARDFMGRAGVRRVWIDNKGNEVKSRNRY